MERVRAMLLAAGLLTLFGGCYGSDRQICSTGLVCAVGMHCTRAGDACVRDACGDGIVQAGEVCDDGNVIDGDHCSSDCKSDETCGNGVLDIRFGVGDPRNEACDDGGVDDTDHWDENKGKSRCSADCKSNQTCGNGVLDRPFPEGDSRNEVCDNDLTNTNGDGCSDDCQSDETCGNGILDNKFGVGDPRNEVCDDGGTVDGDHWEENKGKNRCSANCKSNETCGNGVVDRPFPEGDPRNEVCDNDLTNTDGDGCSANCQSEETCGNGILDNKFGVGDPRNEACDDGNRVDGDFCSSDCLQKAECGNGVVDADEQCDSGSVASATCDPDCTFAYCGDGTPNAARGEECDGGDPRDPLNPDDDLPRDTPDCDRDCTMAKHGDGLVNHAAQEQCDGGPDNNPLTSGCTIECTLVSCGNGVIDPGEECDDGDPNALRTDGAAGTPKDTPNCDSDCTKPKYGDYHVNGAFGEECDDGEADTAHCNYSRLPGTLARCGDGYQNKKSIIKLPNGTETTEQCDDPQHPVECNANCTKPQCHDGFVGYDENGVPENCDVGPGNNASCRECRWSTCGDNVVNDGFEECDPGAPGKETELCNRDCTWAYCGDGKVNAKRNEECEGGQDCSPPFKSTPADAKRSAANAFECKIVVCGDNEINPLVEVCDHGPSAIGTEPGECSPGCRTPRCGDGTITVQTGEECDDGPANLDQVEYGRKTKCNSKTCKLAPYCGDGKISDGEKCDGPDKQNPPNGRPGSCSKNCMFTCPTTSECDVDQPPFGCGNPNCDYSQ